MVGGCGILRPSKKGVTKMYKVVIEVDGQEYVFGQYERNTANEVAMQLRDERRCDVSVYPVKD